VLFTSTKWDEDSQNFRPTKRQRITPYEVCTSIALRKSSKTYIILRIDILPCQHHPYRELLPLTTSIDWNAAKLLIREILECFTCWAKVARCVVFFYEHKFFRPEAYLRLQPIFVLPYSCATVCEEAARPKDCWRSPCVFHVRCNKRTAAKVSLE
jgi:hypothetical protein